MDDLPYKQTAEELGLPIYTRDFDLVTMGAPVIWTCIDKALRDHARSRSITFGFTVGTTYTVTIAVGAIQSAVTLVKKVIRGFARLPDWLKVVLAGTVAMLILHPKSRGKLVQLWRSFAQLPDGVKESVLDGLIELVEQLSNAEDSAVTSKREIEMALPAPPRLSLVVHARRILLLEKSSSLLHELAKTIKARGYHSRSANLEPYLRRILRESGQFQEVGPNIWILGCLR